MTNLWKINLSDFWRGLIVAVFTSVLAVIYEFVQAGNLDINWKSVLLAGLGAGIAYLLKNFSSDSNGRVLGGKISLPDNFNG